MRPRSSRLSQQLVASLALVFMLATTACASEEDNEAPGASGEPPVAEVEASADAESSDVEPADSEPSNSGFVEEELEGALVASFPSDVPLYDGQVVESRSSLSEPYQDPEWAARITTSDPIEDVDATVRASFSTDGWTIANDMDFAGSTILTAHSSGYIVSISYQGSSESGAIIDYGVSEQ